MLVNVNNRLKFEIEIIHDLQQSNDRYLLKQTLLKLVNLHVCHSFLKHQIKYYSQQEHSDLYQGQIVEKCHILHHYKIFHKIPGSTSK